MLKRTHLKRFGLSSIRGLAAFGPLGLALLITAATPALAGGFQLTLETPGQAADPQFKDVVLVVRTYGCHQPADAKLLATAEGFVKGKRQSAAVELRSISPGVYGIEQQWPNEGTWVLALSGAYNGMTCSVLVDLGANGNVLPGTRLEEGNLTGVHARAVRRKWVASEIDAALKTTAGVTGTPVESDGSTLSPLSVIAWLIGGLGASGLIIGLRRPVASKG